MCINVFLATQQQEVPKTSRLITSLYHPIKVVSPIRAKCSEYVPLKSVTANITKRQQFQQKNKMKSFPSLALPIFVVLIWTLVEIDVTSAQQAQANNASHLLHDQIMNLLKGSRNRQQFLCVVCAGIADEVEQCRGVIKDVGRCITNSSTPISGTRKKRHASRRWNPFTWNNFPSFPSSQTLSPISGQGGPVTCPQQMPQSYFYALSADATDYPAIEIGVELETNPLAGCLLQQVVLPGDFPPLYNDTFLQTSGYTCPFIQLRLYSYYSPSAGSRCWFMQTFQENVLYKLCTTRYCQNCNVPSTSSWPWYGFPNRQVIQNLCTTEYRQVSLWAYCPDLNPGERIVWDRIIIPLSCHCQPVRCTSG